MRYLYHLLTPSDWTVEETASYRAASLDTEGFIHCSHRDQVARVANCFFADQPALCVLCINADRLDCPVREEAIGTGERFPHVYGPIPRPAIVAVRTLQRDAAGRWVFPDSDDAVRTP